MHEENGTSTDSEDDPAGKSVIELMIEHC